MIRFDASARRLTLSVRDLADENDYRFSGPTPLSLRQRAALGRLEHEVHQGSREENVSSYRRERSVSWETRLDGWTVVVVGRIDGIYTDDAGRTVIEEVKTVVGAPAEIEAVDETTYPAYTRQLQLYRYLLEAGSAGLEFTGGDAPEIALHLCLIALPSRHQHTLELPYDRAGCQELVERRLRELLANWSEQQAATERRRQAAEQVRFPHAELRPGQADMIAAIEQALVAGKPTLVSAPPGVGKTAGALIPALRHALSIGGRVFVATSKTTQQAMFAKTLRLLREAGAPVRSVVLQAKEKTCLNDVVHCHPEACEYARDYAGKLERSDALRRLAMAPVADPPTVRAEAEAHRFCPFEASLDLTGAVDVIVGDYNYAFDPGASLKRMFQEGDPGDVVLVIDEAHNLYERGMGYYSPVLRCEYLRELERALLGRTDPISRRARGVARRLLEHLHAIDQGGAGQAPPDMEEVTPPGNMFLFADPEAEEQERRKRSSRTRLVRVEQPQPAAPPLPPESLAPEREVVVDREVFTQLRDELNELSVAWFAEGKRDPGTPAFEDPIAQLNRAVNRFVNVLELEGDEFSTIWRRRDGGSLRILCKDPSRQLGRRIRACAGAVAVSATLEPLEFYRDVLGFGPDAALHAFPSPFDRERRKVLVLDLPSTRHRDRERDLPIVEDAVRAVLAAHPGNYLVCCPSFAYLERLHDRMPEVPGLEVRRQARFMNDDARRAELDLLGQAAAGERDPIALFVVQGGIFTEGVDYPGDLCIGAVIVGPGLPALNFERELIQAHFEQRYGKGFDYAFLYPGMNKVIQAAGRVIRTPTDRGIVALVGHRFATRRYADLLPKDWYRRRPRELVSKNPYEDLRAFWEQVDG